MSKERLITHDSHPAVRLAKARRRRDEVREKFEDGADPRLPLRDAFIPPKAVGRAAITDEKKFGALLRDMEAYTGWRIVIDALKFQILILEKRTWIIPAERMKMRREYVIPLSVTSL